MGPVPDDNRDKHPEDHDEGDFDNFHVPDVIVNADSSESDDDGGGFEMGYQLLPQEIDASGQHENQDGNEVMDDDETADSTVAAGEDQVEANVNVDDAVLNHTQLQGFPHGTHMPSYMQVPDLPRPDKQELLWNQPRQPDHVIDPAQAEKIKSAMAGFRLPASNIPDWAKAISEEDWKKDVLLKIRQNPVYSSSSKDQKMEQTERTCVQTKSENVKEDRDTEEKKDGT